MQASGFSTAILGQPFPTSSDDSLQLRSDSFNHSSDCVESAIPEC